MRNLLITSLILMSCFLYSISEAQVQPALVKVRIAKNLSKIPVIPNSYMKQVSENVWRISGNKLVFNSKKIPQNNFVFKKENGQYDLISLLGFDDYLAGVVASEMPTSWPLEALKAQAIVARSYALAQIKNRQSKSYHLDSDHMDQVFNLSDSTKSKIAVESTGNMVLVNTKGEVIKAYFHSDCGGRTVNADEVWGQSEFNSGTAIDPWCSAKISNTWNYQMEKNELSQKLQLSDVSEQRLDLTIGHQLIPLAGKVFKVQKLREIFGFSKIKSSLNRIEISGQKVNFFGQGYGHGVGLCQHGTLAQVRSGRSYQEVIQHYYPKAKLIQNSVLLGSR